jgi:putative transposase
MAGIPKALHLDNAKEFESAALVRGCQEYGIELKYRPPGRPHFGGHVERLIGTMMGAVHLLPGTTFSNVRLKGEYKSEIAASLTLAELERWLALEIAGVYHNSIHSTLGRSPLAVWKEAVSERKPKIRQPSDTEQFFIEFLPGEMRILQRDGIRLFNIRYWDNVLSPMVGRIKQPMLVKYDPRNMERVYLRDLEGTYWRIPYLDLGLPPISLWELQEARRRLKDKGRLVVDEHAASKPFASNDKSSSKHARTHVEMLGSAANVKDWCEPHPSRIQVIHSQKIMVSPKSNLLMWRSGLEC